MHTMSGDIELTRLERLIIWMRRNRINFSGIGESLGITRMSASRLCKAERIPRERHRALVRLGIPTELLPVAEDVKRGRKRGQSGMAVRETCLKL